MPYGLRGQIKDHCMSDICLKSSSHTRYNKDTTKIQQIYNKDTIQSNDIQILLGNSILSNKITALICFFGRLEHRKGAPPIYNNSQPDSCQAGIS